MFEKRKLRKYADSIIGFAYEYIGCTINTYLVINNGKFIFVNYKTYYLSTSSETNTMLDNLIKQGYKDLNYWINNKQESKKLIKSKIENPVSMNSERPLKK